MRIRIMALLAAIMPFAATPAFAANLIVNGDFESVTGFGSNPAHSTLIGTYSNGTAAESNTLPQATGWQTHGYNFVFMETSPGNTGADDGPLTGAYTNNTPDLNPNISERDPSRFSLWGPDNGSANGMTTSPTGGSFLGADAAFGNEPIFQVINGLEAGTVYKLTFWWAAAQQAGYYQDTTEAWSVCFGTCDFTRVDYDGLATYNVGPNDEIYTTATVTTPEKGFIPWQMETMYFTATSTSQTLSLLSHGTPIGQPPFALLDGLNMEAIPEPTTWAMMLIGFGLIGGVMRGRRPDQKGLLQAL